MSVRIIISKILNWPRGISDDTFWKVIAVFAIFIYGITLVGILVDSASDWGLRLLMALVPITGFTLVSWLWKKADLSRLLPKKERPLRSLESDTTQYQPQLVQTVFLLAVIAFSLILAFLFAIGDIGLAITTLIGLIMILVIGYKELYR